MNENMTVSQLYDNWIDRRKIVIGYGSGSTYKFYFDNYLLRRFGDREVNLIPKGEYAAFVSALRNIKGTRGQELSTAALKQIVRAFRMMFEFGKNEYGLTNPAEKAKIAHKDNTDSSVFTDEEIDRLENAATLYDIHHISILLCLHTGITRSEVCSLKWENIDIDNSKLKIRRYYDGADNGGRKLNRDVPIPDRLVDQLSIIKSARQAEDYLMTGSGSPMDVSVFRYHYINFLKKAGVEYRKFGTLRNTFAAKCLADGMEIEQLNKLLGNPSISVTIRRYVNNSH